VQHLLDGGFVAPRHLEAFRTVTDRILELITPVFADVEAIRVHGDCHQGNIFDRGDEGIIVIDFDDMAMAPPVQDLWMLLPGRLPEAQPELRLVLEGYEMFAEFDDDTLRLIEPLRAMRLLYFLAWVSRQTDDSGFAERFPGWGDDTFWQREIRDLEDQLTVIRDTVRLRPNWG